MIDQEYLNRIKRIFNPDNDTSILLEAIPFDEPAFDVCNRPIDNGFVLRFSRVALPEDAAKLLVNAEIKSPIRIIGIDVGDEPFEPVATSTVGLSRDPAMLNGAATELLEWWSDTCRHANIAFVSTDSTENGRYKIVDKNGFVIKDTRVVKTAENKGTIYELLWGEGIEGSCFNWTHANYLVALLKYRNPSIQIRIIQHNELRCPIYWYVQKNRKAKRISTSQKREWIKIDTTDSLPEPPTTKDNFDNVYVVNLYNNNSFIL
jgi:hypothetical protein